MTKRTHGFWLFLIAICHNVFGVLAGLGVLEHPRFVGRQALVEIVELGVIGSIEPDPLRTIWFWFMGFGVLLSLLAWLMHRLETGGYLLPGVLGWSLLALMAGGGLLVPASGFWLGVPVAAHIVWAARRGAESRASGGWGRGRNTA